MTATEKEQAVGKLLREERDAHTRCAYVDAELSDAATLFQKAATQIEAMLANDPASVTSALSRINMNHVIAMLGEREVLQRKINAAHVEINRLRSEDTV